MDLREIMNDSYVREEVKMSNHPLTEYNDITSQSSTNMYRPKVWAQTRQELCETLNYFRTYRNEVYHKDNVVYAYLMDALGAKRNFCNGRVIISHGGGKSGLLESQLTNDVSVCSLLNNLIDQQPVVIIVDNKCPSVTFKVPARYCVLGMYLITHAWPEYEVVNGPEVNNEDDDLIDEEALIDNPSSVKSTAKKRKSTIKHFIRWKFRFEWMTNQEFEPWWESPVEILIMKTSFSGKLGYRLCHVCKKYTFWIYKIWMCLNYSCKSFWQIWNSENKSWEMAPQELAYGQSFLNPGFIPEKLLTRPLPFSIIPPLVPSAQSGFGSLHWKGYHCRRCGRLSCRVNWNGWECFNCHKIQPAPKMIIDESMLVDPYRPIFTGPPTDCNGSILEGSGIIRERIVLPNGAILMDYKFPEDGHVYHYVSNKNSMPDLFLREFQEIDSADLKRHPINGTTNRAGSRLYSRQFTLNIGANYKQASDSDPLPWSDAPEVCKNIFAYIQDIVRDFIPQADFNEMLSAVYMEGQKMSWQGGGEKGVSPVIAALSLGSPAEIKFRRKPKKNESKLADEVEPTDINDVSENTSLEIKECEYKANKKKKLTNNESSSQNNQDKSNANRNNGSKRKRKKVSKKVESSTSKVEQIAENTTDVQLPSNVSEKTESSTSKVEQIDESTTDFQLPSNDSEKTESSTSKVEQIAESTTDFQLPPLRNYDTDMLPEFSSDHTNQFSSLPVDTSGICIKKRLSGSVLLLNLHHGDLVIMKDKVLQDNYDHMVISKGFYIITTIRHVSE